jgi:hypothetical protein
VPRSSYGFQSEPQGVGSVSEGLACNSEAERSKVEGAVRTCTDLTMMLQGNSS